jgi:translocation and assembly module TamB
MRRVLWVAAALLAGVLAAGSVAGILILRSAWFFERVRDRIVEEVQRSTGAEAELGAFHFDWRRLEARVDGFVLHGSEPRDEEPFVRLRSATLRLRLISAFQRQVNLESLVVEEPRVRIILYPDGSTNIPGARSRPERSWTEELLRWKIGDYELRNGSFTFDQRRLPLNLRGRNLDVRMRYLAAQPAYAGTFESEGVRLAIAGLEPIETAIRMEFELSGNRIAFRRLEAASGSMAAELSGVLEDLRNLRGTFRTRARASMRELVRQFHLPADPAGSAAFEGDLDVAFGAHFHWRARGQLAAQGLRFVQDRLALEDASLNAEVDLTPSGAQLRRFTARAAGATVAGSASLPDWRGLRLSGTIAHLSVRRAAAWITAPTVPWDGLVSGTLEARFSWGRPDFTGRAILAVAPSADGEPVEGRLEISIDQARREVVFGPSSVATPFTRIELDGVLGKDLRVRGSTRRLEDLSPLLALSQEAPGDLPLRLNNGSISIDGRIRGPWNDPQFAGLVSVVNGQVGEVGFERFAAEMEAGRRQLIAREIDAVHGRTAVTGSATLRAKEEGDYSDADLTARLSLRNLDLAEAARLAGLAEPLAGSAAATLQLSGTVRQPEGSFALDATNLAAAGERIDRLRLDGRYRTGTLEITDGVLSDRGAEIRFSGSYRHPAGDWRTGDWTLQASSQSFPVTNIERIAAFEPKLAGIVAGRIQAGGRWAEHTLTLASAAADLNLRQIVVSSQNLGELTVRAQTERSRLTLAASGSLRESRVDATGSWQLEEDAPGGASIRFSGLSVDTLQDLVMLDQQAPPPTVEGVIEGDVTVSVPLRRPASFQAEIILRTVALGPRQNPARRLNLRRQDITLRNSRPVVLKATAEGIQVETAQFVARDTEMNVTGNYSFSGDGVDLAVRGNIDLAILQLLQADLQARGNAAVNAAIRGSLRDPLVNGQMTLAGAQLYFGDLPTGVDKASGTVLFDRRRATVQQLTAETGGGRVTIGGFLEFGETLVYRLQAQARNIRIRYPQDVSTSFDATLALNGTAEASTLSGRVTLNRATFNITADMGQLLAQASQPGSAPASGNEYLSGMQLDVRIVSGPNFQLETSLSSNVEADVDLRLRGTLARPILLGSVAVNRGEVQVFGNRYQVERGDIRFLNPVRIEPSFDMDLSTRARGVTVNISFSGTLQRMNVNYSSDPPLQSSEIIALLAVGRDPMAATSQVAPGVVNNSASSFAAAGGSLLSQVAPAQVSNRLQRFFGASRVKIDPTLTGVDNLPQARLTLEQQVSKDITLTYITNLNRTQEQIVRVQWDLNREWSAIAVRDPNGLFGIDFQFRKRF